MDTRHKRLDAGRLEVGVSDVLERAQGRGGDLTLRRRAGHLELISCGTFLMSEENEVSSRAMITAALPLLPARPLDVLIGGLGLGYALDQALELPELRSLVVAELEPLIVDWYRRYCGDRARRAFADARVRIEVQDVAALLGRSAAFDLVSLDTDNGPAWLVHESNALLYSERGIDLVRAALRPSGVAVFWSPERYPAFEAVLTSRFGGFQAIGAVDVVAGRSHQYTMYVVR